VQEHVHTGIVHAVWTVAIVLVGFNLLRYAAIKLDDHPAGVKISKIIGTSLDFANAGVK